MQKLSYREKLSIIDGLIRGSKELVEHFDYFYITFAMLSYNPDDAYKLSLWIHPDVRSQKPLHLIVRATQEEK